MIEKSKVKYLEEIKTLQANIFIKIDVNNLKEINQILTTIIDKQVVAEFNENNPF